MAQSQNAANTGISGSGIVGVRVGDRKETAMRTPLQRSNCMWGPHSAGPWLHLARLALTTM